MKTVTGTVRRHTNEAFYYSYYVDFYRFPESMLDIASTNLGKTITVEIADNNEYVKRIITT